MTTRILIVDDSAIDRKLIEFFLKKGIVDVSVSSTDSGQKALDAIAAVVPHAIITDLQMPGMNGLELVEQIKARGCTVPVILMTGSGTQAIAIQALRTGAACYVPKGVIDKHLVETVKRVLSISQWQQYQSRELRTIDRLDSHFTLENDPSLVSRVVAYLQDQLETMQLVDHLQITRIGMAIYESLTNAIYHGNLELDSELRKTDEALFFRMAVERRRDEPYASRRVRFESRLSDAEFHFVVTDDGLGYNSTERRSPTDEINLDRIGGRGLLLIRSFMDVVTHNTQGNEITMIKRVMVENSETSAAVANAAT